MNAFAAIQSTISDHGARIKATENRQDRHEDAITRVEGKIDGQKTLIIAGLAGIVLAFITGGINLAVALLAKHGGS